jgi:NADP-dependent 3-hydroxy acid dehydrogenase YdfG
VALVTGAATVTRLVEDITRLVLVDRDGDGLQRLVQDQGLDTSDVLLLAHDVARPQAWQAIQAKVAEHFGRLDVAVVNAGVTAAAPITERCRSRNGAACSPSTSTACFSPSRRRCA